MPFHVKYPKTVFVCSGCGKHFRGVCPFCKSVLRQRFQDPKTHRFIAAPAEGAVSFWQCSSHWCSRRMDKEVLQCPECKAAMEVKVVPGKYLNRDGSEFGKAIPQHYGF